MNYSVDELMTCVMSRLLRDGERVFFGLASPLAMVSVLLARATHAPNLVFFNIPGGVTPPLRRLPRSTVDSELVTGGQALFSLADVFDLSARGGLDVAFLSGVQIDGQGRINMSAVGDYHKPKVRLPGGAGSALILPTARRVILWRTKHDRRTFVEKLDFTTAAGRAEYAVTPLCLFRLGPGPGVPRPRVPGPRAPGPGALDEGRLEVASIHPGVTPEQLREATGFPIEAGPDTPVTAVPTPAEIELIRTIDPEGVRKTEF